MCSRAIPRVDFLFVPWSLRPTAPWQQARKSSDSQPSSLLAYCIFFLKNRLIKDKKKVLFFSFTLLFNHGSSPHHLGKELPFSVNRFKSRRTRSDYYWPITGFSPKKGCYWRSPDFAFEMQSSLTKHSFFFQNSSPLLITLLEFRNMAVYGRFRFAVFRTPLQPLFDWIRNSFFDREGRRRCVAKKASCKGE